MGVLAETATCIGSTAAALPEKAINHCRDDLNRTINLIGTYVDKILASTSATVTVATDTISARLPDAVTNTVGNVTAQTRTTLLKTVDSTQELAGAGKEKIELGLKKSADKVKSVVNKILALENVQFCREKFRVLVTDLLHALEDFLQTALPYVTEPSRAAYEKLVLVYGTLADYVKKMFEDFDDGLVTPGVTRAHPY